MGGSSTPNAPPPRDCTRIKFKLVLSSPSLQELSKLKVSDILNVELFGGQNSSVPAAMTFEGEYVGAIAGSRTSDLKACIQDGFGFEAVVLSIFGAACEVLVRSANR